MRHYAEYNDSGNLTGIGTGYGGVEITKDEYDRLLDEIRTKAAYVNRLYNGDITIEEVPVDWRDEIQRRVDERRTAEEAAAEEEISSDELMTMIEEVL